MEGSTLLTAILLFLFAAVVTVPIARRLGIGAVLGYLIAGIAIGPWGLGFIRDVDEILHFSELGVVFLMFIIGLELNPSKPAFRGAAERAAGDPDRHPHRAGRRLVDAGGCRTDRRHARPGIYGAIRR